MLFRLIINFTVHLMVRLPSMGLMKGLLAPHSQRLQGARVSLSEETQ